MMRIDWDAVLNRACAASCSLLFLSASVLCVVATCARAQCPPPTFGAWADRLDREERLELFDFVVARVPWAHPRVRNWPEADRLLWTQLVLRTVALKDYERGWWE